MIFRRRGGIELEGKVGEECHLSGAGMGVEEVEEVGVVGWEAVAEMDGFHRGEERVGGVMVVEVAWTS